MTGGGGAAAAGNAAMDGERSQRLNRLTVSGIMLMVVGCLALAMQLPLFSLSPSALSMQEYMNHVKISSTIADTVRVAQNETMSLISLATTSALGNTNSNENVELSRADAETGSSKVEILSIDDSSGADQTHLSQPEAEDSTKAAASPETLAETQATPDASSSSLSSGDTTAATLDTQTASDQNATPPQEETKHKPLNVIVLYPDDMRHDSLSCAGTQPVYTPFLDQMAREGIRFRQNCVTTSICWISRATLFSGQYASRHQALFLFRPIPEEKWNATFPAILRQHGYYLGHIGKWQYHNVGFTSKAFDDARIYEGRHIFKDAHVTVKNRNDAIDFLRKRPKDRNFAMQVAFYAPKAVGEGYSQWTPQDKSLALYQNVTLTYPPGMNESFQRLPYFFHQDRGTEARRRFTTRFATPEQYDNSMKNYYRMINEVDDAARDIYNELIAQNILEETMIIFTTDNGFHTAEHGLSGKWFPYEESIRVPLIIRDPRIPPEKRGMLSDEFTLNIDLASTILGAAGLPSDPTMQGRDIADLYLRPTVPPWRQEFYYEFASKGKKIIPEANAVVRHDFKYFIYPEWNVEQLFNIKEDPKEENDVINDPKYAHVLADMRRRYNEMKAEVK